MGRSLTGHAPCVLPPCLRPPPETQGAPGFGFAGPIVHWLIVIIKDCWLPAKRPHASAAGAASSRSATIASISLLMPFVNSSNGMGG